MKKLISATILILVLAILNNNAFAQDLHCHFTDRVVEGVKSIVMSEDKVIINEEIEVPLEMSEINCSNFGRQLRFDGVNQGYQLILKSCTSEASLEGVIIDTIQQQVGDIVCL